MGFYQKETQSTLRHANMLEVNEFLVLDYVRSHDPTTQTQIASDLGLSPASVSRIVRRLRDDGLVSESGTAQSPGGRPRTLLTFRRDAGCVIAVDLGGRRCHAALADLSGETLHETLRPSRDLGDPFETLLASIEETRAEAERRSLPVVALAVGIPGVIDPRRGVARAAPNVGWEDFPLVDRLAGAMEIPFVVDNDVNLAALAHAWRGDARFVQDFVTISIGTGTGAAIVSGGQLIKGRHNAAGEIGYLVLRRDQLMAAGENGLGRFEAFVSGPGIAGRAHDLLARNHDGSILEGIELTSEAVLAAAASGDVVGRDVLEEVLDALSMAMIAFVCAVDPELIVLDGAVGRSLAPYLGELADRVAPAVPVAPRIVVSRLGRDATVIGAIAAALQLARRHAAPSVLGGVGMAGMAAHVG